VFENSLKREISNETAAISRWNLVFKHVLGKRNISFDFQGYAFRLKGAKNKRGTVFISFLLASARRSECGRHG
jgi:hypothetical protein